MSFFTDEELSCPCCGENKMDAGTLVKLNNVRSRLDSPMIVSSGYRCPEYNKQRGFTQTHATGQAVDIVIHGPKAVKMLQIALNLGFTGVGINQKGERSGRFIHLDDLPNEANRPRPWIWSY